MWLVYASVMHSSSDPGGGGFVMAGIDEVQGVSPVVVVCSDALGTLLVVVHGKVFIVRVGGGSGGGRAVVQATEGGGTNAVGSQHRHSL